MSWKGSSAEVCCLRCFGVGRGRPAAKELQRFVCAGAGLGGVGEERQAGIGGEVEAVVRQMQVADDGMVEVLDAGVVEADVVRGPAGTEGLALRRELAD